MTLLTTDQITEIADTLEALGDELNTRGWAPDPGASILSAAASYLVSIAVTRAPVPQQAYYAPPPPYPYGPEDFRPGPDQAVPLQLAVTGSNRQELEDRAYQAGRQVFGDDASLTVTLAGQIVPSGLVREGVTQYTCSATVRQENAGNGPATYSPRG